MRSFLMILTVFALGGCKVVQSSPDEIKLRQVAERASGVAVESLTVETCATSVKSFKDQSRELLAERHTRKELNQVATLARNLEQSAGTVVRCSYDPDLKNVVQEEPEILEEAQTLLGSK